MAICNSDRDESSQDDQLRRIVHQHYDLGELLAVTKMTKGMVNQSYKIETLMNGARQAYLFRRYKPTASHTQINFEHALLFELRRQNFLLTPEVIKTQNGESYLKISSDAHADADAERVAIFSFLPGENKYEWYEPISNEQELRDAALALALYHQAIDEWKGPDEQPAFFKQLPKIVVRAREGVAISNFERYLLAHHKFLDEIYQKIKPFFDNKQLNKWPQIVIHPDYHAANLLFKDGQVSAILDLDYATMHYRVFDVTNALMYLCADWDKSSDGPLSLTKFAAFLTAYQQAWPKTEGIETGIGPLNRHELQSIPQMIQAKLFFDIQWFVDDHYIDNSTEELYMPYLHHYMRLMQWVEEESQLERLLRRF